MSQPPRKRLKQAKSAADDGHAVAPFDGPGDESMMTVPSYVQGEVLDQAKQCKELVVELNDSLDALESCADRSTLPNLLGEASIGILRLKALQRRVLRKAQITQAVLSQMSATRDEQESKLQNLKYQQALNESSIVSSRNSDSTELVRLVRSATAARKAREVNIGGSVGPIAGEVETTMDHEGTLSQAELLRAFLGGDPRDPAMRSLIVARLNDEVANRQALEGEVEKWRKDLLSGRETLAAKKKLLRDLPHKLDEMEKASLPLQKFCQKALDVTQKLGTQRRQRLDLAATLPKALYTLFYQLQSCLDIMATSVSVSDADDAAAAEDSLPVAEVSTTSATSEPSSSCVMLRFPIPTVSDGGALTYRPKKTVTITFQYVDEEDMVYASCGTEYDMGYLISEVFPGDKGEWTPTVTEDRFAGIPFITSSSSSSSSKARPYQWCNYLAGVHIAPGEHSAAKMRLSANVIVKALIKRVRATATLHWIVHNLSRKPHPIPVHSAMHQRFESCGGNHLKIEQWTAVAPMNDVGYYDATHIRIYEATFKDTGSASPENNLTVRILINVARYPSIPPSFQIASVQSQSSWGHQEGSLDSLQSGQTPLYNERLTRLQKHVNRDVNQLVTSSDETTYDWVLAQQIAELARGWTESAEPDDTGA